MPAFVANPSSTAVLGRRQRANCASRASVRVQAAAWNKATTKQALKEAGGKQVVEIGGQRILVIEDGGEVYALANKCVHLGLPLQGKTAVFQAKVEGGCVVCPAHGTAFDLKSGDVKGEWCPKFPNVPLVGKITSPKPQPTFETRVDNAGNIEVMA